MKKENLSDKLRLQIDFLEEKKSVDYLQLKSQFLISIESIRPANIIKDTLRDLTDDAEFKSEILKNCVSIASGYIAKKIVTKESNEPIKQIFGSVIQMGIMNLVSKNSSNIKSIFQSLFSKKEKE